jgi:hypothetical protein
VLTVTITEERAQTLCALAAAVLPEGARKHFLFTSRTNFSLSNPTPIFSDIYLSPRSIGVRCPLGEFPVSMREISYAVLLR